MKYLKKIFENFSDDDVRSYIINHMAFLFDEGFDIKVESNEYNNSPSMKTILIYKKEGEGRTSQELISNTRVDGYPFQWQDICDYFIPFYTFFIKEYRVISRTFYDGLKRKIDIDPKSDKAPTTSPIYFIEITIFGERMVDFLRRISKTKNYSHLERKERSILDKNDRTVSVYHTNKKEYRIYYIFFKGLSDDNPCKTLRLLYNTQKSTYGMDDSNITMQDNFGRNIDGPLSHKFERFLNENGVGYSTFNYAWSYIEDNYNNR